MPNALRRFGHGYPNPDASSPDKILFVNYTPGQPVDPAQFTDAQWNEAVENGLVPGPARPVVAGHRGLTNLFAIAASAEADADAAEAALETAKAAAKNARARAKDARADAEKAAAPPAPPKAVTPPPVPVTSSRSKG